MAEVFFLVGATEEIKKELSGKAVKASREAAGKKTSGTNGPLIIQRMEFGTETKIKLAFG